MVVLKKMKPSDHVREVWFNELRIADMDNQGGDGILLNLIC
jgi:hypothetical protein